jgi:hypothetical protein
MKTTLKFALAALVLTAGSAASHAQIFQYGGLIGANYGAIESDIDPANLPQNWQEVDAVGTGGWHAGLYARLKVLMVYVQPELVYTRLSHEVTFTDGQGQVGAKITNPVSRVDMPVQVGVKLGFLRAFVAPVWSVNINSWNDITNFDPQTAGTWGAQAGVGLQFGKKVQLNVRYEGNLTPYTTNITLPGNLVIPSDNRLNQLVVDMGFAF